MIWGQTAVALLERLGALEAVDKVQLELGRMVEVKGGRMGTVPFVSIHSMCSQN